MGEPTPGPWTIYADTNIMAGNRLVANCGGYSSNVDHEKIRAENAANARLIAKARHLPELVEALEDAQNLLAGPDPTCEQCEVLDSIAAALALVQDEDHG